MNLKGEKVVVCGAGGFVGGHLVRSLLANGVRVVRAVDVKPLDEWFQVFDDVENHEWIESQYLTGTHSLPAGPYSAVNEELTA